jgi:hypothetical protein
MYDMNICIYNMYEYNMYVMYIIYGDWVPIYIKIMNIINKI